MPPFLVPPRMRGGSTLIRRGKDAKQRVVSIGFRTQKALWRYVFDVSVSADDLHVQLLGLDDEDISNALQFPATKREILNKLQLRVAVFSDRIELNAVFPIEVIECQKRNHI